MVVAATVKSPKATKLRKTVYGMIGEVRGLRSACTSVSSLDSQGKRDEARTMLAEIYRWFTEGCDTADLRDGKALLDELSA